MTKERDIKNYVSKIMKYDYNKHISKIKCAVEKNYNTRILTYLLIAVEIYMMLYCRLIVKLWMIMNASCSLAHLYSNINKTKICVKNFAILNIIMGGLLIIFYSVGYVGIVMILLLINRLLKNVFCIGY